MKTHPIETADRLLAALQEIFPSYTLERDEYDPPDLTFHTILQDFIHFFRIKHASFTERQFKKLARIVNDAVEAGGQLENAFGTCFLEHLGQLRIQKPLSSFLSDAAKERLIA